MLNLGSARADACRNVAKFTTPPANWSALAHAIDSEIPNLRWQPDWSLALKGRIVVHVGIARGDDPPTYFFRDYPRQPKLVWIYEGAGPEELDAALSHTSGMPRALALCFVWTIDHNG
jgi:hypothetical protein